MVVCVCVAVLGAAKVTVQYFLAISVFTSSFFLYICCVSCYRFGHYGNYGLIIIVFVLLKFFAFINDFRNIVFYFS